ncbi:MAG: glycosyltransferase [Sumerlaeia bacterium]
MLPKSETISVLQVVPCVNIQIGGPSYSVPRLAQEVQHQGFRSLLFALEYRNQGPINRAPGVRTITVSVSPLSEKLRGFSRRGTKCLHAVSHHADLIHNHGLWMGPNFAARQAAQRRGLPYIISPRGMLNSWSLNHHSWKKKLAWSVYEKYNIRQADVIHATSDQEAEEIRKLKLGKPIATIPNGVDLPNDLPQANRNHLERLFPELKEKRWILFLSRIHEKKGIDDLLVAWARLEKQFPDWHLIIAGSDFTNHSEKLQELTYQFRLGHRLTFTGPLADIRRSSALHFCDMIVLPSYSENFGLVVAEALAHKKPVITTTGTPWRVLVEKDCGWWIEKTPENLESTLKLALSLPKERLETMGENGFKLITDSYCWEPIGKQMASVYHWILKQGPKPSCIN